MSNPDCIDKMNRDFGIRWSSRLVFQEVINSDVVTRVEVTVLPKDTDVVSTTTFFQEGINTVPFNDGYSPEIAYSEALKDACSKWGY